MSGESARQLVLEHPISRSRSRAWGRLRRQRAAELAARLWELIKEARGEAERQSARNFGRAAELLHLMSEIEQSAASLWVYPNCRPLFRERELPGEGRA
jgi:hypothetical protein